MSDQNGITQSPFTDAWATPDVKGTGLNGIGGGISDGSGGNGLIASPFKEAWPTPGTSETPCAELGQPAPQFVTVEGGSPAGSQMPSGTVEHPPNTIDRK